MTKRYYFFLFRSKCMPIETIWPNKSLITFGGKIVSYKIECTLVQTVLHTRMVLTELERTRDLITTPQTPTHALFSNKTQEPLYYFLNYLNFGIWCICDCLTVSS